MIVELTVENLAIIDRTQLRLGPGFTVLTGETGAGKSLLIDALELALGERADSDLVRSGSPSAKVHVALSLQGRNDLKSQFEEHGISISEDLLTIEREVFAEGRSQARINGKIATAAVLKRLGQELIDLHGQHDHQSLLAAERHVDYLDDWIGSDVFELRELVKAAAERVSECDLRLKTIQKGLREREHRLDLLNFQIGEIESVNPQPGEWEDLESQLSRLKHAERLAEAAYAALSALSDGESNVRDLVAVASQSLISVTRFDSSLAKVTAPLEEAAVLLEDALALLRTYSEDLDSNPTALDDVAGRIDSLKRLRRKYGEDEQKILEFLGEAQGERDLLTDGEGTVDQLSHQLTQAQNHLQELSEKLSFRRKAGADEFSELVQTQLRDLAMDRAVFGVSFTPKPADARGIDTVDFVFSANAGEPPRALARIASGGEISRVMLAIKTAMAGRVGVPTLIFDEVDTGLGGRAAAAVARKLEALSGYRQVLVISHLPQIAARADRHFRIEKQEVSGRVVTVVHELSAQERVSEIARMLAGDDVSEGALANARELLGNRLASSV